MNCLNVTRGGKFALAAIAAAAIGFTAQAQYVAPYTLTDGNSVARVDVGSQAGMYSWGVNGQSQLFQQWFWFRVGGGPEASIDTIASRTAFQANNANLTATYFGNGFNIRIDYTLLGGAVGSGTSDIIENISVINTSATSPLTGFHFFQYSNFDLLGTALGDTVTISGDSAGGFWQATQTEGSIGLSETITIPYANHAQAGAPGTLLGVLNDAGASTLNDTTLTYTGDAAWAFQWDFDIAAGSTYDVIKDKRLQLPAVPEPSSLALLSIGALAFALRRQRR